jgi:phosphoglycolate phosphatase
MTDLKAGSVRALIFDLDGTLIDSKLDLIHSVNAMLRELGRGELREETISAYIGHGAPKLVARALGENGAEEERQRALDFFLRYYESHKMDTTSAYPGVAETLEKLASVPMAVLTNKPVRISVRILDAMGLSQYFRAIYGGNSFLTKKPDPLGARTILRELGAEPGEALLG